MTVGLLAMNKTLLFYSGLVLSGVAIGAVARGALDSDGDPAVAPPVRVSDVAQLPPASNDREAAIIGMIESLSLALTQESEYRLVLEEQIDSLSERIDQLQGALGDTPASGRDLDVALKARMASRQRNSATLTVDRLVAAGMDEATARAMKTKVDDIAMQRLYLRDQAMREGWVGDQRYRQENMRLASEQNGLRNEFGETAYEAYLYASGRPNRVQVQNVLENSPAFEAGLRTGDQVLSYNGKRTFMPNELRQATQRGTAGEMIPLKIRRNGQTMDLYVPRGPLGIQMTGSSEKPGD